MPTLYLMRHGEADGASPDIDRQLTTKGQKDSENVANHFLDNNITFDQVCYSTAARAKQTALIVCNALSINTDKQTEDARIYNASARQLHDILFSIDSNCNSVLLVGHNPGFADLVMKLSEEFVHLSAANVAVITAESWEQLLACDAKFLAKI